MRLRADCPLMVSSSERRPLSTCARYSAATATLTVLAIGKGVLPLMLTVSPVLRSSAAIPMSADLFATIELSCCSRLNRLGDEAAAAGCATNANSDRKNAMNRIVALPAYSCADARIITKCPHSFQIVKISQFGTVYVHD